jgi:hypothetical protein
VAAPTLVITGGPLDGTVYPLPLTGEEIVVGSSMDAGVQIMLGNVEPVHARVAFGPSGLLIEDMGSATGTFVNGEKIEGEQTLNDGDRVCLGPPGAKGSAKLLVLLPGPKAAAAPALSADVAAPALFDGHAAPFLGGEPAPALALPGEAGIPQEFDLTQETETIVVDLEASGPPLEAAEAGPELPSEGLFSTPLPPVAHSVPPHASAFTAPRPPATPSFAVPPPPAPAPPAPAPPAPAPPAPAPPTPAPPAPAPPAPAPPTPPPPAPPPPPPRAAVEPLTAPAPPAPPARPTLPAPPPSWTGAPKPEYQTELPSIPVERPPETTDAAEFPALRPAAKPAPRPAAPKGKGRSRRRPFSLPSLPVLPILGGAAVLAAVAGAAWFLFFRGAPPEHVSTAPNAAGTGQAVTIADALVPDVALPGQAVLVKGAGFGDQKVSAQVGGVAAPVEVTANGVRVTIPPVGLPEGSKTALLLVVGAASPKVFDLYVGRLPLVLEVVPPRGAIGERVVVKGRGFLPDPRANTVTFGGQTALVLSATPNELTVVAPPPPPEMIAEVPVVVIVASHASGGTAAYYVQRRSTSGFVPRFFAGAVAEAPGEALAFVSTELGPVLLLGGPAEAASTAERAAKVSAALNALVDGAASKPIAFELRERPQPAAVGVVGDVRPFLVPTPEDAAAYSSRNWETGRGPGRRVTPLAVARHWASILQDYFGLFLYRQRPLQMAALSPRGKVLSEIYGEAGRRSPGANTVPWSVVVPTPAAMAAALRQMALVVSTEAGRAAVAVEGRWDGTIEAPDLGQRRFELVLRTEGGRLVGTLTTFRGGVAVRANVRDIAFERGNVRFTADQQGTAYQFKGMLEGSTVAGTIERAGKPPAQFTLRFVE